MPNKATATIAVEVVYALPRRQTVIRLELHQGVTVAEALKLSKIAERHPEINVIDGIVGIYGKQVTHDTVLKANDRIEYYRPLRVDPKLARRRRTLRR